MSETSDDYLDYLDYLEVIGTTPIKPLTFEEWRK